MCVCVRVLLGIMCVHAHDPVCVCVYHYALYK